MERQEKSSSDEINYIMKENSIRLMISLSWPLLVCGFSSQYSLANQLS